MRALEALAWGGHADEELPKLNEYFARAAGRRDVHRGLPADRGTLPLRAITERMRARQSPESTPEMNTVAHDIHTGVKYGPLELIEAGRLADECTERWWNQTLSRVDDCVVRLSAFEGECHFHSDRASPR